MIRFKYNDQTLDVPSNTSLGIEGFSPILRRGEIPGLKVYNTELLQTPRTRKALGLPEVLAATDRQRQWNKVELYLGDILWNVGTLKLRESTNSRYSVSLHTDAADLAVQVNGKRLRDVDLGSETADYNINNLYGTRNHAFPVVYNPDFYEDENPDYYGYLNYYHGGTYSANPGGQRKYSRVPMVFAMHVLTKIVQNAGYYGVTGPAASDTRLLRALVINNRSIDAGTEAFEPTVVLNQHMPDISVGAFLIDICVCFGLYLKTNPLTGWVELHYLRTPFQVQTYLDWQRKAYAAYKIEPNDFAGIEFAMAEPENDTLFDNKPAWLRYAIDGTAQKVETECVPILTETLEDTDTAKTWTVGTMRSQGRSPMYPDLGDADTGLRLGFYQVVNDSGGNPYPQITDTYDGLTLRFEGSGGIVENFYTEYVDFLREAERVTRNVRLTLPEFRTFDFANKVMIDRLKFFVDRFQASVDAQKGIRPTNLELLRTRL